MTPLKLVCTRITVIPRVDGACRWRTLDLREPCVDAEEAPNSNAPQTKRGLTRGASTRFRRRTSVRFTMLAWRAKLCIAYQTPSVPG